MHSWNSKTERFIKALEELHGTASYLLGSLTVMEPGGTEIKR